VHLQASVQPEHNRPHRASNSGIFGFGIEPAKIEDSSVSYVVHIDAKMVAVKGIQEHGCIEYVEKGVEPGHSPA